MRCNRSAYMDLKPLIILSVITAVLAVIAVPELYKDQTRTEVTKAFKFTHKNMG